MKRPYTLYKRGSVWHYKLAGDAHCIEPPSARKRALRAGASGRQASAPGSRSPLMQFLIPTLTPNLLS